jgi:hypothetical protein
MKSYQNPQPQAVERADKLEEKPSNLAGSDYKINTEKPTEEKSDAEIFKTESEEQAWKDVLKKNKK